MRALEPTALGCWPVLALTTCRGCCILRSPASSAGRWRQQSTKIEAAVRIKWVSAQRDSRQCVGHSQWAINAGANNSGRGKADWERNQKRYVLVLARPPYKLKKLAGHSQSPRTHFFKEVAIKAPWARHSSQTRNVSFQEVTLLNVPELGSCG